MSATPGLVGLDGLFLNHPTTGSGQYALQLWRCFSQTPDEEPPVRLLRPAERDTDIEVDADTVVVSPPGWLTSAHARKLWWEQRGLNSAARRVRAAVVHTPYFSAPLRSPVPVITTVHDVIPLIFPDYARSLSMRLYLRLVSAGARRAARVLTDSECSRRDIQRYLGIPGSRITVIPLAADGRFRPMRDPEGERELRERYCLPGQVIFNVGGLDARKNIEAIVEAFARSLPDIDDDARLVIAGAAHSSNRRLYPPVEPMLERFKVVDRVVLTGRISEDEKLRLYNLADVYVFASLYEGFGLSPLEAMACGTAVVCSNRSSLPEVVGSGGILIDPMPERLASAIVSLLKDRRWRREIEHRGLEQAARFSWARTADLTRAAYRQVLERAGAGA
jgi:glycosyltransferase involved in cell wall biosynthesis